MTDRPIPLSEWLDREELFYHECDFASQQARRRHADYDEILAGKGEGVTEEPDPEKLEDIMGR